MSEEIKEPKLGIIIITYNISTKVFILQIEAIKSFCKDDYEILVVDNSNLPISIEHIKYHAEQMGVNYTKTFSADQNSSTSHSFAAGLAYNKFKDQFTHLLFLDHDAIPLTVFSVFDTLVDGKLMGGIGQHLGAYVWPGLFYLYNEKIDKDLVDFSPDNKRGFDTGGGLNKLIEKYGSDTCIFFNEAYQQNPGFIHNQYGVISLLHNQTFAHLSNASNWNPIEMQEMLKVAYANPSDIFHEQGTHVRSVWNGVLKKSFPSSPELNKRIKELKQL